MVVWAITSAALVVILGWMGLSFIMAEHLGRQHAGWREMVPRLVHKERVEAETVERSPISRSRDEGLALASSVGADDPFEVLVLPEPEPVDPPAEQTPAGGGLSDWFDLLGWEWPW